MNSFVFFAMTKSLLRGATSACSMKHLPVSFFVFAFCSGWCFGQNPRLVFQPAAKESIHAKLDRDQLEELLYGTLGGSKQAFRRSKKESFQRYIDRIDQVCDLSEEQLNKIQSAVEIEIARWESRVTALLCEVTPNTEPAQKQTIFTQAWAKAIEFQNEPRDTESTVWYKTLVSSLTPEQSQKLEVDREKLRLRERAVTRFRMILLLQRSLGLSSSQRRLVASLLEKNDSEPGSEEINSIGKMFRLLQPHERTPVELTEEQWERLKGIAATEDGLGRQEQRDAGFVVP